MYTRSNQKINGNSYSFGLTLYNEDFQFVPESVVNRGIIFDGKQHWFNSVLEPSFQEKFAPYSKPFSVQNIAEVSPKTKFLEDYEKSGFTDERGYLVPKDVARELFDKYSAYNVNKPDEIGFVYGPITGLATNEQGVKYYNVAASGKPGATAWIAPGDRFVQGQYVTPSEKKKWYESPLGLVSGALLIGSGLGLAGIGPLASGAAAGGATAGALGTGLTPGAAGATGLTAGAAGVTGLTAPAGFALAPGIGAGAAGLGILDSAQFGQTGQTGITPGAAGQGLQTPTTPGLSSMGGGTGLAVPVEGGTVTQLGFVPTGATPVLGDPSSFINDPNVLGTAVTGTDALALPNVAAAASGMDWKNMAMLGLLGAGMNPVIPQQQGLPGRGGAAGSQGVDYSGLLSLLQLQAKTPGVSSLTQPAQLRQMYQTTLLPNVLSLLG